MTVREMIKGFELSLGQLDKNLVDRLNTVDIEYYLNVGQNRYVSQRFSGNNLYGTSFEETQKRVEDLRPLAKITKDLTSTTNITNITNSKFFSLSSITDYVFYINSFTKMTRDDVGSASQFVIGNKLVKYNDINKYISNPFNNPIIREPLIVLLESNGLLLIHDANTTIVSLDVQYVRKPKKLTAETLGTALYPSASFTNTCELPEYAHTEIITMAVSAAYENKPEKYEIGQAELTKVE
jgi:hypothetical protein